MNSFAANVVALVIAAMAGGLVALVTQTVAARRRTREDRGRDRAHEQEAILNELNAHRATLAYHSGLLELLCRRFDISTARARMHVTDSPPDRIDVVEHG